MIWSCWTTHAHSLGQFDSKTNCLWPNMWKKTHTSDIKNTYLFILKSIKSISSTSNFDSLQYQDNKEENICPLYTSVFSMRILSGGRMAPTDSFVNVVSLWASVWEVYVDFIWLSLVKKRLQITGQRPK